MVEWKEKKVPFKKKLNSKNERAVARIQMLEFRKGLPRSIQNADLSNGAIIEAKNNQGVLFVK
jgi:hypothetical protein